MITQQGPTPQLETQHSTSTALDPRSLSSKTRVTIDNYLTRVAPGSNIDWRSAFASEIWPELQPGYKEMMESVVGSCKEAFTKNLEIKCDVACRLKEACSILKSLERCKTYCMKEENRGPYMSFEDILSDIHDLVRIQVVLQYPSDRDEAIRRIEANFVQVRPPTVFQRHRQIAGRQWDTWFGAYETCNYRVKLGDARTGAPSPFHDVLFEVQLTNIAEDMYNKLAHDLLYKKSSAIVSRRDEIVIDLAHGQALNYALTLEYFKEHLNLASITAQTSSPVSRITARDIISSGRDFCSRLPSNLDPADSQGFDFPPDDCSIADFKQWLDRKLEHFIRQCADGKTVKQKACRYIPLPRNEDIVVRSDVCAQLHSLLSATSQYQAAALWGLGGSGKTQVALDYAYRQSKDPDWSVYWVDADNAATFTKSYKAIARKLGLADDLDGEKLLITVREQIEGKSPWLLVLDNADDLTLFGVPPLGRKGKQSKGLLAYVPSGSVGTVLWTSRNERIASTLVGTLRGIQIGRMSSDEAKTLLERSRKEAISSGDVQLAEKLFEELQWLPLAVSQAGAYMQRMSTSIQEYLFLLGQKKQRWEVLTDVEPDRHRRNDVSNSFLDTLSISIDHIQDEMACKILYTLAFVDNQAIPFELLAAAGTFGDQQIGEELSESRRVKKAISQLRAFSFIGLHKGEGGRLSFEMHKLVQEATRYSLFEIDETHREGKDATYFVYIALQVVARLFPYMGKDQEVWPEMRPEMWAECDRYTTHAVQLSEWAEISEKSKAVSDLLTRVSGYLYNRGRWRERESVNSTAHRLRLAALGERHPETIESMAALATTYHAQGRHNEAEEMSIKVLALRREVLGERHPDTIWSMADVAATSYEQGRHNEAEEMSIKVLALRREVLGERHPDTIWSMAALATTYYAQGRYNEDEEMSVNVLALRREVLGERHPDTIRSMADLATTYHAQGRYNEAEEMSVKVLALRREVLGERHPDTLYAMHDLAITWNSQDRWKDALSLMDECLQLRHSVLGTDHPFTTASEQLVRRWQARSAGSPGRLLN